MRLVVDHQIEVERSEFLAVAAIRHERLYSRHDDGRAEQLSRAPRGLVDHRLVLAQDNIEFLHRLLCEFDAIYDEKDALGVASHKKPANQRGAEQRFTSTSRHFQKKFAAARVVVALRNLLHSINLIAAQNQIWTESTEIFRADDFRLERPRRL